ncbi:MAG TPA: bifunctional UDP-N-acetylglucosamine diphosphorylase/glucosamine-1-phosphate N-acetyltransferase GlmU [Stellaceae bacterium]|jgi:bifunctional UDP-N-acetylglucosamine pyrophosphorylase/glucosamine-1-phosphate N-acetyltransferase
MNTIRFAAVILAAGKGSRMKSDRPKVMHPVANRPMIRHVADAVAALAPVRTVLVLAPGMEAVAEAASPAAVAIQETPRGTGHAMMAAMPSLGDLLAPGGIEDVLVLTGDAPLITAPTLAALLEERRRAPGAAVAVLGMRPDDPGPYGRLKLGADGRTLEAIVEAADASPEERAIRFCNSGVIAVAAEHLEALLGALDTRNAQGEYYLTDIVAAARRRGLACRAVEGPAEELAGVNSRAELAAAEAAMQRRLRAAAMADGVTLVAPETVFLSADTKLGRDVVIGPHVVFGPGVTVGDGAEILSFCHFTGATIGPGAIVGPFARLRPGAEIGEDAHIGNFVEVKQSKIGRGAKANHLSYIGDSDVGERSNLGAGTITCNYDGFFKSRTVIGAGVFVGSNTALVAPVTVGDGAMIGAGSVITRNVSADALAVERARQIEVSGAAAKFRERKQEEKRARQAAAAAAPAAAPKE